MSFAHFPSEILWAIVEVSANSDNQTALALSLVSTWVRSWTEPIIYHTVILSSTRSLNAFLDVLSRKPAQFIEHRVKHLGILALGPIQSIERVISACRGLDSLACGFPLPSYAHLRQQETTKPLVPREQHFLGLACCGACDPSIISPSVTHLRISIPSQDQLPAFLTHLSHFTSLTHLAIAYRQGTCSMTHLLGVLQDALSSSNPQLILVQVVGSGSASHNAEVEKWNNIALCNAGDQRIVAEKSFLSDSMLKQWADASKSGLSIWRPAEQEVERRNRNSILVL